MQFSCWLLDISDNKRGKKEINVRIETLLELDDTKGLLINLFMIMEGKRTTREEKNKKKFRRVLRAYTLE